MLHKFVASGFLDACIVSACAIPGNPVVFATPEERQLAQIAGRGHVLAAGGCDPFGAPSV
jgi:hypothetical protein